LLGGLTILSLLWWFNLKAGDYFPSTKITPATNFKPWAIAGLAIVACQIALGGWTSANYAALVCSNFPYCSAHEFFPQSDFRGAFDIFNITNTHLSHAALITIQMTHRIGAMVTGLYVGVLSICLITMKNKPVMRRIGAVMLLVLLTQIALGVLNIELLLPLSVAVLHNAVAAFLLLIMVTFLYASLRDQKSRSQKVAVKEPNV